MNDDQEKTRRLSLAARPALLETACEPDLLMAMVLANLMSPSLWEFRDKIHRRCAEKGEDPPESHERIVMEEIHDYMNKHLFHVSPVEIQEIWGCVDLEEERRRLGAEHVDHAMNSVRLGAETRRELGILTEKQSVPSSAHGLGRFPDYEYSIIDLIEAHRKHLRRKKHKPIGITSCADEAVLSASLPGRRAMSRWSRWSYSARRITIPPWFGIRSEATGSTGSRNTSMPRHGRGCAILATSQKSGKPSRRAHKV